MSRGIVAAVRQFGGRFLELDEPSGCYFDIGDQKAYSKTSQALREGQTQIRRSIIQKKSRQGEFDVSLLGPLEVPEEGYFGYSYQVLESLHNEKTS